MSRAEAQRRTDADIVRAASEVSSNLSKIGFPMSAEMWRNIGDNAPVNNQASIQARALHRSASKLAALFNRRAAIHPAPEPEGERGEVA